MSYAVTLSASFVTAVAFQQHLPTELIHNHSRRSTAFHVLTNPNNLVRIEKKNSIADRTALEELFIRSSSDEEPIIDVTTRKKKNRRPSDELITNTDGGQLEKNSKPLLKPGGDHVTQQNTLEKGSHPIKIKQGRTMGVEEYEKIEDVSASTSQVLFKGLTTGPHNSKNLRKKSKTKMKLNYESAPGTRITYDDEDEYIRSILRKKEELFRRHQPSNIFSSSSSLSSSSSSSNKESPLTLMITKDAKSTNIKHNNILHSSRSSTMPGLKERTNTGRIKAYRDGIKIAEQTSGSKIAVTNAAKKKRIELSGKDMYKTSDSVPDSLVQFADEIHGVDRITPKEEKSLGEKTQEAIRLQDIYDGLVTKLERDPTDDEWCAAAGKFNIESLSQTIEEGFEAKNKLVTSNLRMVQGVVNVYIRNGLQGQYNAGDLMQEGILSLMRAAEKFDPDRGFRFSTYAMYWIRSGVKRDQLLQSRVVQIPQRLHENSKKINKVRKDLKLLLDRPPTYKELGDAIGMSKLQIERCETAVSQKFYSLDQQMVNRNIANNAGKQSDTIQSILQHKTDDEEVDQDSMFLHEDLMDAIKLHLSEEEANIIILRFGMDTNNLLTKRGGRTISEVSSLVGLKPDKVRRTINKGLKELQVMLVEDFGGYSRGLNL